MSEWNYSVVLICPAADQQQANTIAELLGYGPDTFSLPAGPEGGAVTHYCNHSFAAQSFVDMASALGQGQPPEGMPVELLPALSRIILSISDGGDPASHFDEVLASHNLVRL